MKALNDQSISAENQVPILRGKVEDIAEFVYEGLMTDGAHHKQWYLAQIGKLIGMEMIDEWGDPIDEGIVP